MTCLLCNGSGWDQQEILNSGRLILCECIGSRPCSHCGKGLEDCVCTFDPDPDLKEAMDKFLEETYEVCPKCLGSGIFDNFDCPT